MASSRRPWPPGPKSIRSCSWGKEELGSVRRPPLTHRQWRRPGGATATLTLPPPPLASRICIICFYLIFYIRAYSTSSEDETLVSAVFPASIASEDALRPRQAAVPLGFLAGVRGRGVSRPPRAERSADLIGLSVVRELSRADERRVKPRSAPRLPLRRDRDPAYHEPSPPPRVSLSVWKLEGEQEGEEG
ncbi:hypothetical protein SKAU_G00375230 [Synaphobranchus kaupii]|uniref:Uncharacterized protein n=1 Tax=Synaphobranchus kaupii TaxID=118154 RepID=A0A9Q1EH03_SYNKA|nr:hypothetical protein SKAU_G00375230 [Synaphobranchus kaupii]